MQKKFVTLFRLECTRVKQNKAKPIGAAFAVALGLLAALATADAGQTAAAGQAASENDNLSIELNKLEPMDKGCRAVLVVNNQTETAYSALKLDLVMFEGGVFARRVALDLAPVRAEKRSVKLFELDGLSCDKISEFLINDVMECKTSAGFSDNCLKHLEVSSLTKTKLSK
jgi:hypothetical protein